MFRKGGVSKCGLCLNSPSKIEGARGSMKIYIAVNHTPQSLRDSSSN